MLVNYFFKASIVALAMSIASVAVAGEFDLYFKPYVAADIGGSYVKFDDGYGDNLFPKTSRKYDLAIGAKLNDYFGVEFGAERTNQKSEDARLVGGDLNLGIAITTGSSAEYISRTKYKGWYGSLVGYIPFECNNSMVQEFSLLGSIGFSRVTAELERERTKANGVANVQLRQLRDNDNKTVLRLGVGASAMFNEHFGLRVLGHFLKTNKLSPTNTDSNSTIEARLKNTFTYTIGALFVF